MTDSARTMRSKIGPMKCVARRLRAHRPLIWFRAKGRLSNGVVEGFNARGKLTARKAYGFRTHHWLEIALYHALAPCRAKAHPQTFLRKRLFYSDPDFFLATYCVFLEHARRLARAFVRPQTF